ncbi:MAG: cytochrome P450 [Pseudomonadota bacterium]|nr:cytochrome P450 [Pseudomonadota bacterium]
MSLPKGPSIEREQLFEIFTTNPFPFLRQCFETYGDLFTLDLDTFGVDRYEASGTWVFMSHPDHLRELFTTEGGGIRGGAANDIQFQQLLPSESSVVIDGSEHLERCRMLSKLVQGEKKSAVSPAPFIVWSPRRSAASRPERYFRWPLVCAEFPIR